MQWINIFAFCMIAMFLFSFLNLYNKTYALLLSLAVCGGILIFALLYAEPILAFVSTMSEYTGIENFSIIYKAVGISLIAGITQDLCKESGNNALANKVELIAKVLILVSAMPLFISLSDIIMELI